MSRDILRFDKNTDYVLELLFDSGKRMEPSDPKYDESYMWTVKMDGEEFVTYATPNLNRQLEEFKKGDVVLVCKRRNDDGNYPFTVSRYNPDAKPVKPSDQLKPNAPAPSQAGDKAPQGYWEEKDAYHRQHDLEVSHNIAKSVCLKLAVESFPRDAKAFNELEIIKRYQTLLTMLDDDLDTALVRLQQAKNVFHLKAIAAKHGKLWRSILSPDEIGAVIDEHRRLEAEFNEPKEKVEEKEPDPPEELNTDGGHIFPSQPLDNDEPLPF